MVIQSNKLVESCPLFKYLLTGASQQNRRVLWYVRFPSLTFGAAVTIFLFLYGLHTPLPRDPIM